MSEKLLSKKFTRRSFLAGLGAAAALPVLAACEPQVVEKIVKETVVVEKEVEVEKEVTVEVGMMPEKLQGELNIVIRKDIGYFAEVVPKFENLHPDVKVNFEPVEADPTPGWVTGLLAGKIESDVMHVVQHIHVPRLLKKGIAEKVLYETTEDMKPFVPIVPHSNFVLYKNRYWGVPSSNSCAAWYYRTDAYEEAGIDASKLNDWDAVAEAGKALKEVNPDWRAIILDTSGWNHLTMFTELNGGGLIDKNNEIIIDSDETIEATQVYADLINVHDVAWTTATFYAPESWQAYKDNVIVSVMMPDWYIARTAHMGVQIAEHEYGRGKWAGRIVPQLKAGILGAQRGGGATLVAKGPNEANAAAFAFYMDLEPENELGRLREKNFLPNRFDTLDSEEAQASKNWFLNDQLWIKDIFGIAYKNQGKYYQHPNLSEMQGIVNRQVPRIAAGEVSAAEGLKIAADEARALPME